MKVDEIIASIVISLAFSLWALWIVRFLINL